MGNLPLTPFCKYVILNSLDAALSFNRMASLPIKNPPDVLTCTIRIHELARRWRNRVDRNRRHCRVHLGLCGCWLCDDGLVR